MRKAVFRADASREIGSGHVVRCLTLADALAQRGWECVFTAVRESSDIVPKLREGRHRFVAFDAEKSADPDQVLMLGQVDLLVVDHYALDAAFEVRCRETASRILVIDDLADRPHDCDMLLDQNYRQSDIGRYAGLVPQNCLLRMGPKYALLQPEYELIREKVQPRESVRRLLIYFGGVDLADMTGRSLRAALSLGQLELEIDVVLSLGSPNAAEIQKFAARHPNVSCHHSLPSLAPLIAASDLSIGAMGATSWERLCLGLPTIGVTVASNQDDVASELGKAGLVTWLGEEAVVSESMIANSLDEIIRSKTLKSWSERCMQFCDGRGASRIVADLADKSPDEGVAMDKQSQ